MSKFRSIKQRNDGVIASNDVEQESSFVRSRQPDKVMFTKVIGRGVNNINLTFKIIYKTILINCFYNN